jgi:hypothetical protein
MSSSNSPIPSKTVLPPVKIWKSPKNVRSELGKDEIGGLKMWKVLKKRIKLIGSAEAGIVETSQNRAGVVEPRFNLMALFFCKGCLVNGQSEQLSFSGQLDTPYRTCTQLSKSFLSKYFLYFS